MSPTSKCASSVAKLPHVEQYFGFFSLGLCTRGLTAIRDFTTVFHWLLIKATAGDMAIVTPATIRNLLLFVISYWCPPTHKNVCTKERSLPVSCIFEGKRDLSLAASWWEYWTLIIQPKCTRNSTQAETSLPSLSHSWPTSLIEYSLSGSLSTPRACLIPTSVRFFQYRLLSCRLPLSWYAIYLEHLWRSRT